MRPASPPPAFRWAEPLDRAAWRLALFIVAAGVLGGVAGLFLARPFAFAVGFALAATLIAAVDAWRVRPESWPRWWLGLVVGWAVWLGVAWAVGQRAH